MDMMADKVIERLDRCGWHQGSAHGAGTQICLQQAALEVVYCKGQSGLAPMLVADWWGTWEDVKARLDAAAIALFPERLGGKREAFEVNDHADTTLEDVKLIIKHALSDVPVPGA